MDPLHLSISIVPLAAYLVLVAALNLSRRASVTTGTRDTLVLALAVTGFAIAGPLELFLPESAAAILGGWVWLPLLVLYALLVSLLVLVMRPSLVVYNITRDELRSVLEEVVAEVDPTATWAGNSAALPQLGVQLALDAQPGRKNVTVVSIGPDQDLDGWQILHRQLKRKLSTVHRPRNLHGLNYLAIASLMAALTAFKLLHGRQEIAQAVRQMLRM